MPRQPSVSVQNNFTNGLKTEFTGLNFPENAATDTDNCVYTLVGNVERRKGIDYEENYSVNSVDRTGKSLSTFIWENAGGLGNVRILVKQVGSDIFFYRISDASVTSPISTTKLSSTVDMSQFTAGGADPSLISTVECQYSSGNGYLFIYNNYTDPVYCTYENGHINGFSIDIKIRDFTGVSEPGVAVDLRPTTLSDEHFYNLVNQGWTQNPSWVARSYTAITGAAVQSKVMTVEAGLGATNGDFVYIVNRAYLWAGGPGNIPIPPGSIVFQGTVTAYSGTSMTIQISSVWSAVAGYGLSLNTIYSSSWIWDISVRNQGYIETWNTAIGNYPSNSDVAYIYKNSSGTFDPATTYQDISSSTGQAPRGHFIIDAFDQQRTLTSGIPNITPVTTTKRPTTGAWFQGRVWYAGVDSAQPVNGNADFYSWTENIYFSQIITSPSEFGNCFQVNDPTSEKFFALLPSDGGIVSIQGCGTVFKLFPIQNGMLVFAANGVWFITGSQGIGFTANDYTVTKISEVPCLSSSTFVSVQGLPFFWNEDGIYSLKPAQQGLGLTVESTTVDSIATFFEDIPEQSKRYARGSYNPIDYVIQWCYRSEEASDRTELYQFDKILNYNVHSKAYYPYTVSTAVDMPYVHDVNYINYTAGYVPPMQRITGGTPTMPKGGTAANINDDDLSTFGTTSGLGDLSSSSTADRIIAKLDYGSNQNIVRIEALSFKDNGLGSNPGSQLLYSTDNTNWTQLGASLMTTQTGRNFSSDGLISARYIALAAAPINWSTITAELSDLNGYIQPAFVILDRPDPCFKYLCSVENVSTHDFTFADERDEDYVDWATTGTGIAYDSYFITGYRIAGQAQRRWQPDYIYMYSNNNTSYKIQGIWDYASNGNSGRFSPIQLITNNKPNYGMIYRRHRVRGQGLVFQIKVMSVDGEPFDISGWSVWETQNTGV